MREPQLLLPITNNNNVCHTIIIYIIMYPCSSFVRPCCEAITEENNSYRVSRKYHVYLGNYKYNSSSKTHRGNIVVLEIDQRVEDRFQPPFKKECVTIKLYSPRKTNGSGIFFLKELNSRDQADELICNNAERNYRFLACRTNGSVEMYKISSNNEGKILRKLSNFLPPESTRDKIGMCTSCDFLKVCSSTLKERIFASNNKVKSSTNNSVEEAAYVKVVPVVPQNILEKELLSKIAIQEWSKVISSDRYLILASFSSGKCVMYSFEVKKPKTYQTVSSFTAHHMEIWCCAIHRGIAESKNDEITFSTGADDGQWKIWLLNTELCQDSAETLISPRLLTSMQHPAGVISICQIMTAGDSTDCHKIFSQKFLVGCYDDIIRLYSLEKAGKPALLQKISMNGGPWSIKQFLSPALSRNCSQDFIYCQNKEGYPVAEGVTIFLVTCMYGSHQIIQHCVKNGLKKCESEKKPLYQSDSSQENFLQSSNDLNYVAEWLPLKSRSDHCRQLKSSSTLHFLTMSYYSSKMKLYVTS